MRKKKESVVLRGEETIEVENETEMDGRREYGERERGDGER